jgi:DNA-binding NtrC family response regulator
VTRRSKELPGSGTTTQFFGSTRTHTQLRRVLLRVKDGPDRGAQVQLERTRLTVGRSAVNDLVLTDTAVSGIHLEIMVGEQGVLVRDLGSTNGTTVNGVRIREAFVEPGGIVQCGKTEIVLLSADEVPVALSERDQFGALFGASPAMREVFAVLERVAPTDMSVLIGGETGTGKELVARALHDESHRAQGPFVVLDCGSLPRDLAEAAILGHRKGSFTGAVSDRAGAFEEADKGTLFLDEIGELPLDLQPKLLRVLDRREVQRIGESHVRQVDVRVVAATHRDLRKLVGQGTFREDLYFRLSVMSVEMPSLRERGADVVGLAERFLGDFRRIYGQAPSLSAAASQALLAEAWPGNVRQLKNVILRAAHLSRGGVIEPADLHLGQREHRHKAPEPVAVGTPVSPPTDAELFQLPFKDAKQRLVDDFERVYFSRLLDECDGNLSRAAAQAGITRYYLRELLKRLGMHRGRDDDA